MNKATFERALKAAATGKPLKEVKFRNLSTGQSFEITGVIYDNVSEEVTIIGLSSELDILYP